MDELRNWLTVKQASKFSNYHIEHIRQLIRNGELIARKWGRGAWMVNRESLLSYVSHMETKGKKRGPKPK